MASQRQSGSKSRSGQARNGQDRGGQQTRGGQQNRSGQARSGRPAGTGKAAATRSPAGSQTAASKTAAGRAASRNAARPAPAPAAASLPPVAADWPVARAWNGSSLAARIPGGRTLTSLPPAPAWLRWTTWLLSLAGLGVSIYLTIEHFTTNSLAGCPESATFNCVKVTTSPESVVFGIFPVAVLGLAFYAFLIVVNSPLAWRLNIPALNWLRVGSLVVGIGFVLYLVYVELIEVQSICLYCTSVHIITFLLFVLVVFDATFRRPPAKRVIGY